MSDPEVRQLKRALKLRHTDPQAAIAMMEEIIRNRDLAPVVPDMSPYHFPELDEFAEAVDRLDIDEICKRP